MRHEVKGWKTVYVLTAGVVIKVVAKTIDVIFILKDGDIVALRPRIDAIVGGTTSIGIVDARAPAAVPTFVILRRDRSKHFVGG